MQYFKKPIFYIVILSTICILLSIYDYRMVEYKYYLLGIGAFLAGLAWIWPIIEVATTNTLKGFQKKFWLIVVISVPVVGGLLYYVMHNKKNKIAV